MRRVVCVVIQLFVIMFDDAVKSLFFLFCDGETMVNVSRRFRRVFVVRIIERLFVMISSTGTVEQSN